MEIDLIKTKVANEMARSTMRNELRDVFTLAQQLDQHDLVRELTKSAVYFGAFINSYTHHIYKEKK